VFAVELASVHGFCHPLLELRAVLAATISDILRGVWRWSACNTSCSCYRAVPWAFLQWRRDLTAISRLRWRHVRSRSP